MRTLFLGTAIHIYMVSFSQPKLIRGVTLHFFGKRVDSLASNVVVGKDTIRHHIAFFKKDSTLVVKDSGMLIQTLLWYIGELNRKN